jgi:hypothetical protein
MADKSFGIKELNLIGASGTPTITSPNNLNLNAGTVAISTDVTIGRHLDVDGHAEFDAISVSGVSTFAGITTVTGPSLFTKQLNVSGVSTFYGLSGSTGDIDLKSNGATRAYWDASAGTFNIRDGSSVTFGDTNDVSMAWDGTDFYLTKNTVAGSIKFTKSTGNETIAVFSNDGPVELYYDNSKKFETATSGVNIVGTTTTGQLSVTGIATIQGLTIKGNSTSYIDNVIITQHPASTFAGNGNVAIGDYSFTTPGAAGENVAIGYYALNIVGNNDTLNTWNGNTAVGAFAGQSGTTTLRNTFIGYGAGRYVTTGDENTILGSYNGNQNNLDIRTSSNNVVLSDGAGNIRLIANAAGNVGLGTTNPTSKLSVNGGIQLAQNNATIVGTSGTAGEIKQIAGAPFYYDGSAWREFVLSSGTPVTQPADTEWDNVVFRATFDDDFTDAKFGATPVFVSAGSSIVGSAVTIGTGSYRNIGGFVSGIGVSYADRSEYDFTGSWTIEFWIYHDNTPLTYETIVSQVSTDDTSGDWSFGVRNTGTNIIYIWNNENNPSAQTLEVQSIATWNSIFLDKWNHYALVREGDNGSIHFYINGIETTYTINNGLIDNDILHISGAGLGFGAAFGDSVPIINGTTYNGLYSLDAYFDDVRISAGVGTAGQRYNSIGISTYATFTPPTTQLPITGTLSSVVNPPGDKYGEITLGGSPTWRGTSGVTVSQQSSGNYRVSFASSYTSSNDYYVLSQGMDQGFASYVGIARSTTHVDLSINRQSNDAAVDTGSLGVQIKNHI